MNEAITLPLSFEPPTVVMRDEYVLEVLAPKHNDIDYDAWNSSISELQGIFGPSNEGPEEGYSKRQNLEDLERHYKEFQDNIAYAYTILSTDQVSCIGCLYIRPTSVASYDARVDFWFRNSHKQLEPSFLNELKVWLEHEWKFSAVAFPGREVSWEDYSKLVVK